jgi:hypothetical protein
MAFSYASAITGTLGLGFDIAGGIMGMNAAKEEANISNEMAGVQLQENATRRASMEMEAQRSSMQQLRQAQQARSYALAGSTKEGSQFGSGLQGAYGSIEGQSNTNLSGISYNLQQGERMFQLSDQMAGLQAAMAQAQGKASSAAGLSAIGGGLGGLGKLIS